MKELRDQEIKLSNRATMLTNHKLPNVPEPISGEDQIQFKLNLQRHHHRTLRCLYVLQQLIAPRIIMGKIKR